MASPTFFADGHTPAVNDTKWMILQKILGATIDGGGGGGGGTPTSAQMWTLNTSDPPPSDGSIATVFARSSTGIHYANIGTVASPDWDQV